MVLPNAKGRGLGHHPTTPVADRARIWWQGFGQPVNESIKGGATGATNTHKNRNARLKGGSDCGTKTAAIGLFGAYLLRINS